MEKQWTIEGQEKEMITLSISDIQPIEYEISRYFHDELMCDSELRNYFKNMLIRMYKDRSVNIVVK